jgi:hypothetical protein
MKANIITELGPVEIDLADYPSLSQIWSTQEVGRPSRWTASTLPVIQRKVASLISTL